MSELARKRLREAINHALDDDLEETIILDMLESDEDEIPFPKKGRGRSIPRNIEEGFDRLWKDYFNANPIYPEPVFRRRFRMPSALFKRLAAEIEEHDLYFKQKSDALGKRGAHTIQKITVFCGVDATLLSKQHVPKLQLFLLYGINYPASALPIPTGISVSKNSPTGFFIFQNDRSSAEKICVEDSLRSGTQLL